MSSMSMNSVSVKSMSVNSMSVNSVSVNFMSMSSVNSMSSVMSSIPVTIMSIPVLDCVWVSYSVGGGVAVLVELWGDVVAVPAHVGHLMAGGPAGDGITVVVSAGVSSVMSTPGYCSHQARQ